MPDIDIRECLDGGLRAVDISILNLMLVRAVIHINPIVAPHEVQSVSRRHQELRICQKK